MVDIRRWEDSGKWVEVDMDLCNGASDCALVCPADAYQVDNGVLGFVYIGDCMACGACQDQCPNDAILIHWAW